MFVTADYLTARLQDRTQWQKVPVDLPDKAYKVMIEDAVKTLYIDTGRIPQYVGWQQEVTDMIDQGGKPIIAEGIDINIDEEKYILIVAQIQFFKKVQTDVNNIVSYTTDALSITSADKPYVHLQDTIAQLEGERRLVFYKMRQFVYEE